MRNINFPHFRGSRAHPPLAGARFFFALDSPASYLMAELVERALVWITWVPVLGPFSEAEGSSARARREHQAFDGLRAAERQSQNLGVSLTAPDPFPIDSHRATRAALFATRTGACQEFALAISRLAFRSGLNIAEDSVIRDAATMAGLDPRATLAAADDHRFDGQLNLTTRALCARGIAHPPAIRTGGSWFEGPDALRKAMAFRASRPGLRPDIA